MLRRIGAAVFGFALVGLVIGSGYWATFGGATAVVVFGLASALVAPLGLSALGYAAGLGQEGLITRLARVPEIERLAARAETEAERLALLQRSELTSRRSSNRRSGAVSLSSNISSWKHKVVGCSHRSRPSTRNCPRFP